MSGTTTTSVREQFRDRLRDFDVESTVVSPDEVTATLEQIASSPAVGVEPSDGRYAFPDIVETEFSPADLEAAATGVTEATIGISDYGSIVVPTTQAGVEPVSLFADQHLAVLDESDLVRGMDDGLAQMGDRFREAAFSGIIATGPSATADMGALVKGAHGPKTVHVVVVEQ